MTAPEVDISCVLLDEAWFGDGGPTWRKAPPAIDAVEKHRAAIRRLRRFGRDFEGAEDLAEILLPCRPDHRCGSGACPQCARAMQRWFVAQIVKLSRLDIKA